MKARRIAAITDTTPPRCASVSVGRIRTRIGTLCPNARNRPRRFSVGGMLGRCYFRHLSPLPRRELERLRIKHHVRRTPLQMLLRAELIGYRHYSDDVVRAFVRQAADSGVDIFRVFDALNDTRNIRVAGEATKEAASTSRVPSSIPSVRCTPSTTTLTYGWPGDGCDSICIKDMAALLSTHISPTGWSVL